MIYSYNEVKKLVKLLNKIFLLFIFIISSLIFILFIIPYNNQFYSILEYKHKLLKNTSSPKIILVGGSSVFSGIDSELLSKKTRLNVVNMAFYFGLGLKFMINEIRDHINENDIIIILPEYAHYYMPEIYNGLPDSLEFLIHSPNDTFKPLFMNKKHVYNVFIKDIQKTLKCIQNVISQKFKNIPYFIYNKKRKKIYNINKYGDLKIDDNKKMKKAINNFYIDKNINMDVIIFINNFNKYIMIPLQKGYYIFNFLQ